MAETPGYGEALVNLFLMLLRLPGRRR